jgi:hypothetical protein
VIGFGHVRPGDKVVRLLGGVAKQPLVVTKVDARLIHCCFGCEEAGECRGWTFNRVTGIEVDRGLGWGLESGVTGSYLMDIQI